MVQRRGGCANIAVEVLLHRNTVRGRMAGETLRQNARRCGGGEDAEMYPLRPLDKFWLIAIGGFDLTETTAVKNY